MSTVNNRTESFENLERTLFAIDPSVYLYYVLTQPPSNEFSTMKWIYLLLGLGQQLTRVVAAPTTEPILLSGLSLTPATFYPNITLPTSILDPFPPPWLIKFYRPYCSHCKAFAPIWKDLQQKRETVTGLKFAQVDCIAHRGKL